MQYILTLIFALIIACVVTRLLKVELPDRFPPRRRRKIFLIMMVVGALFFQFSINFYWDCAPTKGCIHWGDPLLKGIKK